MVLCPEPGLSAPAPGQSRQFRSGLSTRAAVGHLRLSGIGNVVGVSEERNFKFHSILLKFKQCLGLTLGGALQLSPCLHARPIPSHPIFTL